MNLNEWDGMFFDAVIANEIMDRILHHAHVVHYQENHID